MRKEDADNLKIGDLVSDSGVNFLYEVVKYNRDLNLCSLKILHETDNHKQGGITYGHIYSNVSIFSFEISEETQMAIFKFKAGDKTIFLRLL